jgi:hypothetical protein
MKFENIRVMNFENALRGMRNPKESFNKIDSKFGFEFDDADSLSAKLDSYGNWYVLHKNNGIVEYAAIGPKDMELAQRLIKAGSEHRKFMRQIFVSVDITAPLYWWKEFDTYKVGTVANSTSTMHTITNHPITLDRFEISDFINLPFPEVRQRQDAKSFADPDFVQMHLIPYLEYLREEYLWVDENEEDEARKEALKEIIWKELIRWLPEGWLQTRTVTMNYENLLAMCSKGQRRFHKLSEWSSKNRSDEYDSFIKFARSLPYAQEFIFIDEVTESTK